MNDAERAQGDQRKCSSSDFVLVSDAGIVCNRNVEKPVAKSNPNADYLNQNVSLLFHELQQIVSTLRREDKIPTADMVIETSEVIIV